MPHQNGVARGSCHTLPLVVSYLDLTLHMDTPVLLQLEEEKLSSPPRATAPPVKIQHISNFQLTSVYFQFIRAFPTHPFSPLKAHLSFVPQTCLGSAVAFVSWTAVLFSFPNKPIFCWQHHWQCSVSKVNID